MPLRAVTCRFRREAEREKIGEMRKMLDDAQQTVREEKRARESAENKMGNRRRVRTSPGCA